MIQGAGAMLQGRFERRKKEQMGEKHLNIPNDLKSVNMTKGTDTLLITVTADCYWCYDDPDHVFGNPPSGFLAAGYYQATNPHTSYGAYSPINDGTVQINATTTSPCTVDNLKGVPQTIVVTGGNK
jgi:hypothetical protein